jgi:hypothetical protein
MNSSTVSFFKVHFLGSFGHLAVLAVWFGARLAGEFFIGPRQVKARDEPYVGRTSKKHMVATNRYSKKNLKYKNDLTYQLAFWREINNINSI